MKENIKFTDTVCLWGKRGKTFEFPSRKMRDEYEKKGQQVLLAGFENQGDRFNFILSNG